MRWCRHLFVTFLLTASCIAVVAQDADSLLLSDVETEFSFEDSLSIFNLIDSLLQQRDLGGSQLVVRLSYNSNVQSTGRTLGIENFGLSPGISYYHKTGFYGDVSGFWSKDFDPTYYLTVGSLGYMHDFSKYFSFMAGYDRYFYSTADEGSYIPYKNSLSVTPILELKPISISANYSYYFGDQIAHRIMPGISISLEKNKLWNIDRIAISPSFYALFGDETIITLEFLRIGRRLVEVNTTRKVFGIMNYAISAPISIRINQWAFSFAYTYNIPKALPGETLTFSESTYLSASLIYLLNFNRRGSQ